MRKTAIFSLALLGLVFTIVPGHADASEAHNKYNISRSLCNDSRSTADTMHCLNRANKAAQNDLLEAYNSLLSGKDEDQRAMINMVQNQWLAYRDTHCEWEKTQAQVDALERAHELSCLVSITRQRTLTLNEITKAGSNAAPPEFGDKPRWMNVLSGNYPNIYWRYGHVISGDIDCDGANEQIISGLQTNDNPADGQAPFDVVLAKATNPETGLPKAALFNIPLKTQHEEQSVNEAQETEAKEKQYEPFVCGGQIKMEYIENRTVPLDIVKTENSEAPVSPLVCGILKISDGICTPFYYHIQNSNPVFSADMPTFPVAPEPAAKPGETESQENEDQNG